MQIPYVPTEDSAQLNVPYIKLISKSLKPLQLLQLGTALVYNANLDFANRPIAILIKLCLIIHQVSGNNSNSHDLLRETSIAVDSDLTVKLCPIKALLKINQQVPVIKLSSNDLQ